MGTSEELGKIVMVYFKVPSCLSLVEDAVNFEEPQLFLAIAAAIVQGNLAQKNPL
jgi:hypothetical protein